MKSLKLKLIAVWSFLMIISLIHAQQALTATGGNASGSGGSLSYSVGQIAYTTNNGSNGYIVQGVQQPFKISVVTGIEDTKGITLQCIVYPNPATDFLTLKVENYKTEDLTIQLYEINGKLLESKNMIGNEMNIAMINLAPAEYFLRVIQNDKIIRTFQIIKN